MTDLSKYSDNDMLQLVSANIEEELKRRGYEFGWYKKEQYVGAIYILTNPAFPNLVKIGYVDDVEKRLKTLNNSSGISNPYHCYAIYKVKKRLEDLRLHTLIDSLDSDLRHVKNREFYEMDCKKAYDILSAIAQINGNEDQLILNPYDDAYFDIDVQPKRIRFSDLKKEAANGGIKKRGKLTFEMLEIPIGSVLTYAKDESITCETVDNTSIVKYDGKTYTLSGLVKYFNNGGSWQGSAYFKYNDELLTDMRDRMGI